MPGQIVHKCAYCGIGDPMYDGFCSSVCMELFEQQKRRYRPSPSAIEYAESCRQLFMQLALHDACRLK